MNMPAAILQQHPLQRDFLEGLLDRFWSGEVYRFSSHEEFSEVAEHQRFGLVFCDVVLENRDGLDEMAEWEYPVIGLLRDGDWEVSDLTPLLERGLVDFLTKPYQPDELKRLCDRWEQILSTPSAGE